ncbi:MAG: 30S ribosomal protein S20 [Leptospiraceae bacterium]|nr:30S ribosomal protein S20 [Leptospiraceae bacterium]MDW8307089.1 30S ribosomal protein S20 [Leptospiraceae bacterium]
MAHTLSAKKRIRQNIKRRLRNQAKRSRVRTLEKKIRKLLVENKIDEAKAVYREFMSAVDKAAKTRVFHKNKAARKKSRLALLIKKSEKNPPGD